MLKFNFSSSFRSSAWNCQCRGSSVSTVTRLPAEWPVNRSSIPGKGRVLTSSVFRSALWPTQPPIQTITGSSPGAKRSVHANYLPESSDDVKNTWNYASTSHISSWRMLN
jgi:hypothetical protein